MEEASVAANALHIFVDLLQPNPTTTSQAPPTGLAEASSATCVRPTWGVVATILLKCQARLLPLHFLQISLASTNPILGGEEVASVGLVCEFVVFPQLFGPRTQHSVSKLLTKMQDSLGPTFVIRTQHSLLSSLGVSDAVSKGERITSPRWSIVSGDSHRADLLAPDIEEAAIDMLLKP